MGVLTKVVRIIDEYKVESEERVSMSKARYKQGKQICSISEFDTCKSDWYKWNGRTKHRSVLMSLQYRTLLNVIVSGRLYAAELIDKTESEE